MGSELNSGKSSLTNTVSTLPVLITEIPIYNWKESTFISTKLPEVDMSQEPSLWILNQEQWTPSEPDHSDNSSDQITSFSDKPELVTIRPKDITPKELNSSTPFSMLSEKKPKVAIAYKDSKSPTPSEEEQDLVWELSQLSHPQKSQIPSSNHTIAHYLSINWSKMP